MQLYRTCGRLYKSKFNHKGFLNRPSAVRCYSNDKRTVILGIETSCDDTGCGIVDENGTVLGEGLNSQHLIHLRNGGIIPPVAQDLHREYMEPVVEKALRDANLNFEDITAIAATVKPGLPLSLMIGMKYGKYLTMKYKKPFIPIHHMEAHALVIRMMHDVPFPFLVLLISGGHCILAIAQDVDKFLLLGQSIDDSPGEAFDKTARRMKLRNLEDFSKLSGGRAIELAASKSKDPELFSFPLPLAHYRDCNFSLSGLKFSVRKKLEAKEEEHGIIGDGNIPELYDLCAGFQMAVTKHLCHRTQRAMEFAVKSNLIPADKKTLVVSGGVACNNFIAKALGLVCDEMNYKLVRPPPKLCTDNGVMIAWNGFERWRRGVGITSDVNSVDFEAKSPLGVDITEQVVKANIQCEWVKLKNLYNSEFSTTF